MKNRLFLSMIFIVIACLTGASLAGSAMAEQKTLKWKMASWGPRLPVYEPIYNEFCLEVQRASNGRLVIEDIYDGEGVSGSQVLESVGSGLVEMGQIATVYHSGKFPAGLVEWGLPGVNLSLEEYMALFEETKWKEVLGKAYAVHNVKWLASHPTHGTYMLTKKPIKSLDDLKGMKLRAVGANAKFVRNLGASAVSVPFAEIYTGLATGVFDGIVGSPVIDISDGKFYEIAKYLYPTPVSGFITNPIIVNAEEWGKLDEDIKEILLIAAYKMALMYRVKVRMVLQDSFNTMQAKGLKWGPKPSENDVEKWNEAGRKTWSEYGKDKYSKELLKIQADFMDNMKALED